MVNDNNIERVMAVDVNGFCSYILVKKDTDKFTHRIKTHANNENTLVITFVLCPDEKIHDMRVFREKGI